MRYSVGDVIEQYLDNFQDTLYTSLVAKVLNYDKNLQVAQVQPLVKQLDEEGNLDTFPIISKVPVIFPSGNGGILSFPLVEGDNVLLIMTKLDIDNWKISDGQELVTPTSQRQHQLNDCVAIAGLTPTSRSLEKPERDVQLSYKGSKVTLLENGEMLLQDNSGGSVRLTQNGISVEKGSSSISLTEDSVSITATSISLNGKDWDTHTHLAGTYTNAGGNVSGVSGNPV